MTRHEMRERALQALYQIDLGGASPQQSVGDVLAEEDNVQDRTAAYVQELVFGVSAHLEAIDILLKTSLEGWQLERVAGVERNILRLAVYEVMVEQDLDVATIIDEAVRLAKDFSGDESGRFVNGVLAKVVSMHPDRQVWSQWNNPTFAPEGGPGSAR